MCQITASEQLRFAPIDITVYSLEAILKTAYRFTDRAYIHLQSTETNSVEIRIRPKLITDDPDTILGDFFNDLIDQRLRTVVANETRDVRDLIMAHALSHTVLIRPDLESSTPDQS